MTHDAEPGLPRGARYAAIVVFFGTACLHFYAAGFLNDHYDRISRARQMVIDGAMPFRDFFDPGYGLTLYGSAWLQEISGYNLLGQTILCVVAMSAGITLTCLLVARLSRSWLLALLFTGLVIMAGPRFYDYDKVLFYPAGIAACWAYAEHPSSVRLLWLAGLTGLAALFRYDNGLYIGSAALVCVAVTHWSVPGTLARRVATYAAAVCLVVAPALLVLATRGVLLDAFEQMATYAITEGRRTALFTPATFRVDRSKPLLVGLREPTPPWPLIKVRWDSGLDDRARGRLEHRYGLVSGHLESGETWWYRIQPAPAGVLERMVEDPLVRDTAGIDRGGLTVVGVAEPAIETWRRRVPLLRVEIAPAWRHRDNAVAWLYYLMMVLPPVAVLSLVLDRWVGRRSVDPAATAGVLATVVLCLLVDVFILRDPFEARIGAVAVPLSVLAAWLFRRHVAPPIQRVGVVGLGGRLVSRLAMLVLLGVTGLSLWTLSAWSLRIWHGGPRYEASFLISRPRQLYASLRESPPSLEFLPVGADTPLVEYLRACATPADPIMATWFAPELYFFAGRPFAAGMPVFFGDHWAGLSYQRRALERLESRPPSLVIVDQQTHDHFKTTYPFIDRYLQRYYDAGGEIILGAGPERRVYSVLVDRRRPVVRQDPRWKLPCLNPDRRSILREPAMRGSPPG